MTGAAIRLGLIRSAGLALALLMNVIAARLLGPAGFGALAFLLSLVTLLAAMSSGGLTSLFTREVAAAASAGRSPPGSPAVPWLLLTSIGLAGACALASALGLLPTAASPAVVLAVATALLGLGLLNLLSGLRRGLGAPSAGDLPIAVVIPAAFLLLVSWDPGSIAERVSGETRVRLFFFAYVAAIWVAVAAALLPWRLQARRGFGLLGGGQSALSRAWLKDYAPFFSLAVIGALNTQLGTLMVAWVADASATAFYRIAERMAVLVALPLTVLNAVLAAAVVRSHARGDFEALRALVRRARHWALAGALPLGLIMIVLGDELVRLLFGAEYVDGARWPLAVLVLGQWVNVACGSVGLVLSMCGHERAVLREQAVAVAAAVCLLPPMIGLVGATGAALVMAGSLAWWNLRLAVVMHRQLRAAAPAR